MTSAQPFDHCPEQEPTPQLAEYPFEPEIIETDGPFLARISTDEITQLPDLAKITELIDGNLKEGSVTTTDGTLLLRKVCSSLGLLTKDVRTHIQAAHTYYGETYWGDFKTRTDLNIDRLGDLYDATDHFDQSDLLKTISTLRQSALHVDVVSEADRLARILLMYEVGQIDLKPYITQKQDDPNQKPVD